MNRKVLRKAVSKMSRTGKRKKAPSSFDPLINEYRELEYFKALQKDYILTTSKYKDNGDV